MVAGGSAVFLNPEPIADFVDLFLIGEGEQMMPEFLAAFRETRRSGRVRMRDARAASTAPTSRLFRAGLRRRRPILGE